MTRNRATGQERKPGQPPSIELTAGLSPFEVAKLVRDRLYADRDYARTRRRRWQGWASTAYVGTLFLSASATVILGLSDLDFWPTVAFILTALVVPVRSLESYFNWRSRWILAEEALAAWHDIEENLSLYVAHTSEGELDLEHIKEFDRERKRVWAAFSKDWIKERRAFSPPKN